MLCYVSEPDKRVFGSFVSLIATYGFLGIVDATLMPIAPRRGKHRPTRREFRGSIYQLFLRSHTLT
jgi:hypothetical protein